MYNFSSLHTLFSQFWCFNFTSFYTDFQYWYVGSSFQPIPITNYLQIYWLSSNIHQTFFSFKYIGKVVIIVLFVFPYLYNSLFPVINRCSHYSDFRLPSGVNARIPFIALTKRWCRIIAALRWNTQLPCPPLPFWISHHNAHFTACRFLSFYVGIVHRCHLLRLHLCTRIFFI